MASNEIPVPPHFNPQSVGEVWKVSYQERADEAEAWARQHKLQPASRDRLKISLLLVDVQNTFCIPDFELYVGGTSGTGAVDDNRRLCDFIYRNLNVISEVCLTMDTHQVIQIFHSIFLVNDNGEHPAPYTLITPEDIENGIWKFNRELSASLQVDEDYGQEYLVHYTRKLTEGGKYDLTIWPYHAMLGGIGHALVSAVEETVFFHSTARLSQPDFQVSGSNPFTESYSALSAEVLEGPTGEQIEDKNIEFTRKLLDFDALIIAGQAKSHCVAWTIEDLLNEINISDRKLAEKVYLLEDCTSPVVIPDVIDYTGPANKAFQKFADAGMHIVRSTDPIKSWPGMKP
jgi:nicotinamidase-related amidase